MANNLYNKARERALAGGMNLAAGTVRVALIDLAQYTFDPAHEFRSSIPAQAVVATSDPLANKSVANGVFDADDVTFAALTGNSVGAVVLYRDTGDAATDELILYVDEGDFPVVPNGGTQVFVWSDGADRIFRV